VDRANCGLRPRPAASALLVIGGKAMASPHEHLLVYQRADDLFIDVHRLTHHAFPENERNELGAQIRRAAFAISANIVEGIARQHAGDKLKFFNVSVSSLRELGYGLHTATRLGYIDTATFETFEKKLSYIATPLNGLIRRERTRTGVVAP
jgi:four helix bundle protein